MPEVDLSLHPAGGRRALVAALVVLAVSLPFGSRARGQGLGGGQEGNGQEEAGNSALGSAVSGDATAVGQVGARASDASAKAEPGTGSEGGATGNVAPSAPSSRSLALPSDGAGSGSVGSAGEARVATAGTGASGKDDGLARAAGNSSQAGKEGAKGGKKGYEPRGPTLVTGAVGFTYGLTDDSVGGFELGFTYGYRLTDWIWFDSQANFSFGSDCKEILQSGVPKGTRCGSVHGFGVSLLAGVQWKFYGLWNIPVVPFLRADAGVVFVVTNGPYDGAAFVARGGGGARYHFTPWFAVGGEVAFVVGPVVRNDMPTNFFASVDVLAGAEFTF